MFIKLYKVQSFYAYNNKLSVLIISNVFWKYINKSFILIFSALSNFKINLSLNQWTSFCKVMMQKQVTTLPLLNFHSKLKMKAKLLQNILKKGFVKILHVEWTLGGFSWKSNITHTLVWMCDAAWNALVSNEFWYQSVYIFTVWIFMIWCNIQLILFWNKID